MLTDVTYGRPFTSIIQYAVTLFTTGGRPFKPGELPGGVIRIHSAKKEGGARVIDSCGGKSQVDLQKVGM